MYQIEAMIIWIVIKILPTKKSLQLAQAMSFDFKDNISLSKCALWGRLNPINLNNFACWHPQQTFILVPFPSPRVVTYPNCNSFTPIYLGLRSLV